MKMTLSKTHLALRGCGAALIVASGCAFAGPNDTSITVTSSPITASVNRSGLATPFRVEYTVTVGNNSTNNTLTYDFKATTRVRDSKNKDVPDSDTYAVFVGSSGIPCTATPGSRTEVTCAKLSVDKNTSKTFKLTYNTPLSVPALDAGGTLRLTVASTSQAIKGSGFADTILVTQPVADINLGFETFVTEQGGLFYTGSVGNGCGGIPGSWPTATDPFTTTLFVPIIDFTTTAKVKEAQDLNSCSGLYTGCFESNLTIPSAPAAFASLNIYLRIGPTGIAPGALISSAVLKYAKDPLLPLNTIDVQSCTDTGGPTSGNPCIRSRRAYGLTFPTPSSTSACNGVWEFLVEAVDNGLYRTR